MNRRDFLAAGGTLVASSAAKAASSPASSPGPASRADAMKVRRLSWAGLEVECGTTTVLIDPIEDRNSAGIPPSDWVAIEATTKRRHALITHIHNDHYDPGALRAHLSEFGFVVCHRSVTPTVAGAGFRTRGVELHEPVLLRELCVTAVEAVDGLGESEVSWIVTGGGRRIFHGGDTLWHGHWWKLAAQYGPFDAAFLPINGFIQNEPSPPSGIPSSLTPEQAVAAAKILRARVLVPIHFGGASPPDYVEYPGAADAARKFGRERGVNVRVARPGETIDLAAGGTP